MNALEIIALIFAISVIVKLFMFLFARDYMKKWMDCFVERTDLLMVLYAVMVVIVGYFVLFNEATRMTVIQVVSASTFALGVIGLTLISASKSGLKKMGKDMMSKPGLQKTAVGWIIWVGLALWVLYVLFL